MSECFATNHSFDTFAKWAKKCDIFLHPDVAFLVPTKTMGFGVFARKPLNVGAVIISCPAVMSISPYAEPSHVSPCISALSESKLSDNVLFVVLRLMAEVLRPASPWLPWLRACPRMTDHLFDLTDTQQSALGCKGCGSCKGCGGCGSCGACGACKGCGSCGGSAAWTGVAQQLRDVRVAERWAAAQDVMRRWPEHWPEERATFSLFCECLAQVLSRNFHREEIAGREGPYLLPGLDIINHSFVTNAKFEIRGGGRKHATQFCVIATRNLQRGEQVFCSYGCIGAPRFAVEFQFVTEAVTANDLLRFSIDTIVEISMKLDRSEVVDLTTLRWRAEKLQRLGLLCDEGLYVARPPPPDVEMAPAAAKDIRTLFNVFYLMTATVNEFDVLIHKINREWEAPWTKSLIVLVSLVLNMRMEAAQTQLASTEENFSGEAHEGRRRLLIAVLRSEMDIIDLLQQHIGVTK